MSKNAISRGEKLAILSRERKQFCSETPLPKNNKDLAGCRRFFTDVRTQACSLAGTYSGPLKQLWDDLVQKFDAAIAALPKESDGDWDLTQNLDNVFSCLTSANACLSQLSLELSKHRQTASELDAKVTEEIGRRVASGDLIGKDSLSKAVEAAVQSRVSSGLLVPETTVKQMCSAAKDVGITEGKAEADRLLQAERERQNLITQRKADLQKASVPLPEGEFERVLGLKEEEFKAAKSEFESRLALLKKDNIQLSSELLANLWLPKDQYATFEKMVRSIPGLQFRPNPLIGNPGDANDAANAPVLVG